MTQSSQLGYYERVDDNKLDADEPVTAARAWLAMNNMQHLIDQAPQHRINWCRDTDATANFSMNIGPAGDTGHWCQAFVHAWNYGSAPTGLDIVVVFRASGSFTADYRVRVIPHFKPGGLVPYPVGDLGAPAIVDETTAAASLTTGQTTYSEQFFFTSTDGLTAAASSLNVGNIRTIEEDGEFAAPEVHLMRFEFSVTTDEPSAAIYIDRVLVREFA